MPQPDPDLIAYHFEQAGDQRAIAWWHQASKRAERAYAWRNAAERLEAVFRCQDQMSVEILPRHALLLEIATLRRYSDPETALSWLDAAIVAAEQAGDRVIEQLARAEHGFVYCMIGRVREGMEEIDRAVLSCDLIEAEHPGTLDRTDADLRAIGLRYFHNRLAARRSVLIFAWAIVGRLAKALDVAEPLRSAFFAATGNVNHPGEINPLPDAPFGPDYQAGNVCLGLAQLYSMLGRVGDAQLFFDSAHAIFRRRRFHSSLP